MKLSTLMLVAAGGGAGSAARYAASVLGARFVSHPFPAATFAVNLIGSFAIGFLSTRFLPDSPGREAWRALVVPGFLGGFTTMSAFAFETVSLHAERRPLVGVLYAAVTVIGCILGAWLGARLAGAPRAS